MQEEVEYVGVGEEREEVYAVKENRERSGYEHAEDKAEEGHLVG